MIICKLTNSTAAPSSLLYSEQSETVAVTVGAVSSKASRGACDVLKRAAESVGDLTLLAHGEAASLHPTDACPDLPGTTAVRCPVRSRKAGGVRR